VTRRGSRPGHWRGCRSGCSEAKPQMQLGKQTEVMACLQRATTERDADALHQAARRPASI